MNKKYKLKLDLKFKRANFKMNFNQYDSNVNDFYIEITNGCEDVDLTGALVVLCVVKPSKKVEAKFLEIKEGNIYADLPSEFTNEIGQYKAKAMLILDNERVTTDILTYEVHEDNIFTALNETVANEEDYSLLMEALSRLSSIEHNEEQRQLNEEQRQNSIKAIKNDIENLIKNTNNEIDMLISNTENEVDMIISKAQEKIELEFNVDEFKNNIYQDLNSYKILKDNEIDNYKISKDTEINENLNDYKASKDIEINDKIDEINNKIDEVNVVINNSNEIIEKMDYKFVCLTQEEYDTLFNIDPNTIYYIIEG